MPEGGTIAVPSPASPVVDARPLQAAHVWLAGLGYRVRYTRHFNEQWGYAAGRPERRARDLEQAFADPEVDAVLCLGGGDATGHVLRHLDFDVIAANPKPFVGFSDITVLHAAIHSRTGLVTFWGPMFHQLASASSFTREGVIRAITSTAPLGVVDPYGPPARTIVPGVGEGQLVGGTASRLSSLVGTPWQPDTRGKILLLEDVDEEPCRVHRYLTHLLDGGMLEDCVGICLGEFMACGARTIRPAWNGPSLTLEEVFDAVIRPLGLPTIYGLPLGHGAHLATVPLGARVRLDADAGRLRVLDAALEGSVA